MSPRNRPHRTRKRRAAAPALAPLLLTALIPTQAPADEVTNPPEEDPVVFTSLSVYEGDSADTFMNHVVYKEHDPTDPELDVPKASLTVLPDADGSAQIHIEYEVDNPSAVHWRITNRKGASPDCGTGDEDGITIDLLPTDFEEEGTFNLELRQDNPATLLAEVEIDVGECAACKDGNCYGVPRLGLTPPGELMFAVYVGTAEYGQESGKILWRATELHDDLYDRPALMFSGGSGFELITLTAGGKDYLRQVKGGNVLVDIVDTGTDEYELRFYSLDQIGVKVSTYLILVGEEPDRTIRIEKPAAGELRVTEESGGQERAVHEVTWDGTNPFIWTLVEGGEIIMGDVKNWLRKTINVRSTTGSVLTSTHSAYGPGGMEGVLVAKEENKYTDYGWGLPRTERTVDPDMGGEQLVSTWTYYDNPATPNADGTDGAGRLKEAEFPGKNWAHHRYDDLARPIEHLYQFGYNTLVLDSGSPTQPTGATKDDNRLVTITYDDDGDPFLRRREEKLDDNLVALSYLLESEDTMAKTVTRTLHRYEEAPSDPPDFSTDKNLATAHVRCADDHTTTPNRLYRVERPNGTATEYSYVEDTMNEEWKVTVKDGDEGAMGFDAGTERLTETSTLGTRTMITTTDIKSNPQLVIARRTATDIDAFGRVLTYSLYDGSTLEWSYNCCGVKYERDRTGLQTDYEHDRLGRRIKTIVDDVVHEEVLDPLGRTTLRRRYNTTIVDDPDEADPDEGEFVFVLSEATYNEAGQMTQSKDNLGGATDHDEEDWVVSSVTQGRKRTTTYPDDGENTDRERRIEYYNGDGTLAKVEAGTDAAVELFTEVSYGSNTEETWRHEIRVGDNDAKTETARTHSDMLGRTFQVDYPKDTSYVSETYTYNALGQLVEHQEPGTGGVTTLYGYDALGQRTQGAVDMPTKNGVIDLAGSDRVTITEVSYGTKSFGGDDYTVRKTVTKVLATDSSATETTISTVEEALDDPDTTDAIDNITWSDRSGVVTITVTDLKGGGDWTVATQTTDDGDLLTHIGPFTVQTYEDGRLKTTEVFDQDADPDLTPPGSGDTPVTKTTYAYDDQGRRCSVTDARTGTTETKYMEEKSTSEINDLAWKVIAPDPDGTGPLGTLTTEFDHDDRGRVITKTLPDTTTQSFEYFEDGKLKKQSGSQLYTAAYTYTRQGRRETLTTYQDAMETDDQVTTWEYDGQRGWLTRKEYDLNGEMTADGTDYTYTDAGRVATRTWARTDGMNQISTTYTFTEAGQLETIDYSDSTPDVKYTYDRLGRTDLVEQGTLSGGSISSPVLDYEYAYTPADPFLVDTVTTDHFYGADLVLTYKYEDGTSGSPLPNRPSGFKVGHGATPADDHEVTYNYEIAGRIQTVVDTNSTFTYTYTDDSNLPATLTHGAGGDLLKTSYTYEDGRNNLAEVKNENIDASPDVLISNHAYLYNKLSQRTSVVNTDPGPYPYPTDGEHTRWDYDTTAGELTSSIRYEGTDPDEMTPTEVTPPQDYTFTFDKIGNRLTYEEESGPSIDYTPNDLNQYDTVDDGTEVSLDYDADGNMTDDGTNTLTWDAENRLIQIEPTTPADLDIRHRFIYDYLGRRIRTLADRYDGEAEEWEEGVEETDYLYDGWNVVCEYDGTTQTKTYTWGLDLSGSINGAAGVGGLLSCEELTGTHDDTYYFLYDGNGNVTECIDSGLEVDAHYEYTPFGAEIVATGTYASINTCCFSTKPLDKEFSLYYSTNRFYSPSLGRWLNRDPIGEAGGENLSMFVLNQPINLFDPFGFQQFETAEDAIDSALTETFNKTKRMLGPSKLHYRTMPAGDRLAFWRGIPVGGMGIIDAGEDIQIAGYKNPTPNPIETRDGRIHGSSFNRRYLVFGLEYSKIVQKFCREVSEPTYIYESFFLERGRFPSASEFFTPQGLVSGSTVNYNAPAPEWERFGRTEIEDEYTITLGFAHSHNVELWRELFPSSSSPLDDHLFSINPPRGISDDDEDLAVNQRTAVYSTDGNNQQGLRQETYNGSTITLPAVGGEWTTQRDPLYPHNE